MKWWIWIWVFLHIPCFSQLLDSEFLKKTGKKPVNDLGKFRHNKTLCIFRYHGPKFSTMKNTVTINSTELEDRKNCSVEFSNLPSGNMSVQVGEMGNNETASAQISKSCDGKGLSELLIYSIKKSGNGKKQTKIGQFCPERRPNNETIKKSNGIILATLELEQKLLYQLVNWDGYQLVFRFKPFRVTFRHLYEKQTSPTDATPVEKAKLMILTNSTKEDDLFDNEEIPEDFVDHDECLAQGNFTCQQTWQCTDENLDRDYFLCKKRKFKCIKKTLLCDGNFDCKSKIDPDDKSDESNCDVLFDNKVLFAVSVFAILLVVVLIVSFIYGYVYRKKSKNRRKSEQEEDGGGGENVVAVAAENAEANTLYIKEGGTIEGAQTLCDAVEASKFQEILNGQGEKEHHENNIEMKPLIKIVKISTVKIEKDLATKVVNNGGQEHQNHQEEPTKKVLLETNFPEIIAEEEEANDDVLYPKSSSTRRHISSPQKNSKPPLTKMENGVA